MKTLEKQFVMNADKTGKMNFSEVKREDDVAIYQRTRLDGTPFNYEVFIVKKVKAGAPLPGGAVEKVDRECYPGANSFGHTAYDCNSMAHAQMKFLELKAKHAGLVEAREESAKTGKRVRAKKIVNVIDVKANVKAPAVSTEAKGKRGRKKIDRSQFKFPAGEWDMNAAVEMNIACGPATLYNYIKGMVAAGEMEVCGKISGGRGKPKLMYRSVTDKPVEKFVPVEPTVAVEYTPF
jgi:hypothetical protein